MNEIPPTCVINQASGWLRQAAIDRNMVDALCKVYGKPRDVSDELIEAMQTVRAAVLEDEPNLRESPMPIQRWMQHNRRHAQVTLLYKCSL